MALEITDQSINEVLSQNEFVVIDFWAAWCGPCRMLGPIVDQIATENQDLVIGKVDVSDNPISAQTYMITSIPCIVFIKNGEEVGRVKGVIGKAALLAKIDEYRN